MKMPVFVDHTGRRRRVAIVLGSGLGVVLIIGLVMLTAGLVSGSPVPLPGWPDAAHVEEGGNQPTPAPVPTWSQEPAAKRSTDPTVPTPATTSDAPGNGNGNGNGHGRPTKTPGKP
jgi:hypothetical protein